MLINLFINANIILAFVAYWQIMDNDGLELGEKVVLINDLLKRHNGDIQE